MLRIVFFLMALVIAGCASSHDDAGHEDHSEAATDEVSIEQTAAPVSYAELAAPAAQAYANAMDEYLQISARLAADSSHGVPEMAGRMTSHLETMLAERPAGAEHVSASLPHARSLAAATALEDQREHFGEMSPHLDELVRTVGPPAGTELHRFVCGMGNAPQGGVWLQADREPRNPYFGASMLRCAQVAEKVPAEDA